MKKLIYIFSSLILGVGLNVLGDAGPAIAPRFIVNEDASNIKLVDVAKSVIVTQDKSSFLMEIEPSEKDSWPGFSIVPKEGKVFDFSPFGRIQAEVTNQSKIPAYINLRIDNPADWKIKPWNSESVYLKPGEKKSVMVYFGYEHGFKPAHYIVDSSTVSRLVFFSGKVKEKLSIKIENIQAIGAKGDVPINTASSKLVLPKNGFIMGGGNDNWKYEALGDSVCTVTQRGTLKVDVPANKRGIVKILPKNGIWNLGNETAVRVKAKNGAVAAEVVVQLDSNGGKHVDKSLGGEDGFAANAIADTLIRFVPEVPWVGEWDKAKEKGSTKEGTSTKYTSSRTKSVIFIVEPSDEAVSFEIESIKAELLRANLPKWLGKRPPVEGEWVQTLAEEFDGDTLNTNVWGIYCNNHWDKRTHFSKDNVIVKDGKVALRYENKFGHHNDNPNDTSRVSYTGFACGILNSYGRFTQKYGYFEARMKTPRANGLWPAFWMMPDRGKDWKNHNNVWRNSTEAGGMEFDIMEHLTGWGPYRFNIAFHWDGYGKEHKALGSSNIYIEPDEEDFITVGFLWLPKYAAIYCNGELAASWESDRIMNHPAHTFFYMVSGGWDNTDLNIKELPADYVIDYYRVWQRKDLVD